MALIKCPECEKEISDKSNVCINCGFPIQSQHMCNVNGKEYDLSFILNENDKANSLSFSIGVTEFAESLNLSTEQLNVCLFYLVDSGMIKCKYLEYNREANASKEITFTSSGVNYCENNHL